MKSDKTLIVKGKRLDGRGAEDMRPIKITAGVIKQADGSCEVQFGETKVIAAVYGPKKVLPRRYEESTRAYLKVYYFMAAFATSERNRPGPSRRSTEISKVIKESLANAVDLDKYPQTEISVYIEVTNANAGTRTAAINAASVALVDAGIEMRDIVTSVAAGKVEGQVILDLMQDEDNFGQADLPVAILPRTNEISLIQMDGDMTPDEVKKAFGMCIKACQKIAKLQREAIVNKYKQEGGNNDE
ncbi:exosome complex exonuclease Rrp41 [Candidatus Woesearchaeota archaeon]|nr:exosome complex exonuclease Rrp41 [Candidatus Woesearchaeota archaeon]MBT4114447.1 exosome complex exonuclease Rrp41 [Candidatus Woesearchaeota archaeon]MBT4248233.1 exosome complex exonuclease Rrp41 [Candidatus Woesearchaeota archaeon]